MNSNYHETSAVSEGTNSQKWMHQLISRRHILECVPNNSFKDIRLITSSQNSIIFSGIWRDETVIIKMLRDGEIEIHPELKILTKLEHPNVVSIMASGRSPDPFIVLEDLHNGTLSKLLDETRCSAPSGRLPLKTSLSYARQIISALKYLHQEINSLVSIVHADLRPENIGFMSNNYLKIFDFSSAVCLQSGAYYNDEYEMVNQGENLAYIAPEVALCLPFNEKADIYSFGIILWELLSGEAPYPEMDEVEHTERFIVQGLRPSLTDAEGRPLVYIPSLLANLMKQCWDDEPHRRPSCGEIAAILDEQERILGLGNKISSCNANQNSSSGCSQPNLKVSSPYPAPHLSSPCPLMKANTNSGIGNKSSGNLLTDILFSFGKKTSFSIQKSSALSKVYVEDFLDLELAGDESTIVTTGSTFT